MPGDDRFTRGWQPVGLDLRKIDRQHDPRTGHHVRRQQTDPARLDHAANGAGGAGDGCTIIIPNLDSIIRYKGTAMGHQLQGKRRFPRPRGAKDENATPLKAHAGRVEDRRPGRNPRHRGRPTTKRAPSGGVVMSASAVRMFSAQITPPCASMICLEIASPRPEWLPNCPAGRSE